MEADVFRTDEEGVRRSIEGALVRREERFALNLLAWTIDGYTVKFGQGIVVLVRTALSDGVFRDEARLNNLLDGIRRDFLVFDP